MNKVFEFCVNVSGDLWSSYVFENKEDMEKWFENEYKDLESKYENLTCRISTLDKLKVGDECNVYGDGDEVYKILDIIKRAENKYSFLLDSGCSEEVGKCHTKFLK